MKIKIKTFTLIGLSVVAIALLYSCQDDDENAKLIVDFTADKQETIAGEKVNFSDRSLGNPSRWNWYFEGGTPASSVLHSPAVSYETPGTYNVKLVIGRGGDSTSLTKEEFIVVGYPEVNSNFTADKTSAIEGETVSFTDVSEGFPTAWLWEFIPSEGEIITSDEKNPAVAFTKAGVYTVKLTASNPISTDEEIKTDFLTIIDPASVIADFNANIQSTYAGSSIQFTDASQGLATVWNWTFEGGTPSTSDQQNPVVTYETPGRYKVTLMASNDAKSSVKEADHYILVVPGDNLVAFYPFDGNEKDTGPHGVHPSKTGDVVFSGIGRLSVNQCAVFTGNSVLVAPDHTAFNVGTTDFSISCWVKTDKTSRMMIWMESGGINGSGDNQTWLRIGDNTGTQLLRFAVEDNTGGTILNVSSTDYPGGVSDNEWHHIVCVRSGLNRKVYIDGVIEKEGDATIVKNVSSTKPFKIGAQETAGGGTYSNHYNGLMDDLIIYDKALTAQEVADLFNL